MGVRIQIDTDRCTGHGRCYMLAPEIYEPDDDGRSVTSHITVDGEHAIAARIGADNCPEDAITVLEN